MKLLISNIIVIAFLCFTTTEIKAQNSEILPLETAENKRMKIIPHYANAQFAGSMGLFSLGLGWNYGKKDQWETHLMLGFIPEYSTDKPKLCVTLKENFIPWNLRLKESNFRFQPLIASIYFTNVDNENFWRKAPEKYPKRYYWLSTKVRANIAIGQGFSYQIPEKYSIGVKSIAAFYEFSTNDLYVVNALGNSNLKFTDLIHLSFGLKFSFL